MNKTVLVTGSSSGIGKATVKLFARHGWNVIATMRTPAEERELRELPGVLVTRLDVQDRPSITQAIEEGIARFGNIDVLINNAGFSLFGLFEAISPAKIQEQFDVNVFGVMDVTRALLPHLRAQRSGVIVNVSSGAGVFTLPMLSLYCSTKFALEGFSEALAYELASQDITVKIVEPGGARGTRFGERMSQELAQDAALGDYDAFVAHTNAIFDGLRASRGVTAEEVAEVIYTAVTDGSDRLRYVASKDIEPLVEARRRAPDQEYVDFMRSRFAPRRPST